MSEKDSIPAVAFSNSHTAEETLAAMRGKGSICACGRTLVPVIVDGKRIGVTHETIEDEDHHIYFFTGRVVGEGEE